MSHMINPVSIYSACWSASRLGQSQPGDLQGQLAAALAYIKKLEDTQVRANAPSSPGSLRRASHLDPGIAYSTHYMPYLHLYIIYINIYIIIL